MDCPLCRRNAWVEQPFPFYRYYVDCQRCRVFWITPDAVDDIREVHEDGCEEDRLRLRALRESLASTSLEVTVDERWRSLGNRAAVRHRESTQREWSDAVRRHRKGRPAVA